MKILRLYLWFLVLPATLLLYLPAARSQGARGWLVVESMTDDVKVYVDGKLIGKTPFNKPIPLRPGRHKLKATKAGYGILELRFTIKPRRNTTLQVDLIPFSGLVRFSANIEGAEVYLDSQLIGHTPLIHDVLVGDHRVLIVKEGYNDYQAEINVRAGEKLFVEGQLTPFQDVSPEVLAIARAQEAEAKRTDELAREIAATGPAVAEAPSWYANLHQKWWFWAATGAALAVAVTLPLALSFDSEQPGRRSHEDSWHTVIDIRP